MEYKATYQGKDYECLNKDLTINLKGGIALRGSLLKSDKGIIFVQMENVEKLYQSAGVDEKTGEVTYKEIKL